MYRTLQIKEEVMFQQATGSKECAGKYLKVYKEDFYA
jgi:hypothetical protein